MNEPYKIQVELLNKVAILLKLQKDDIDEIGKALSVNEDRYGIKAALLVNKARYLNLFSDIIFFLAEKLLSEKGENFRFYVGHLRTLVEIYTRLLYSDNQTETRRMALWVADTLFTFGYTTYESGKGMNNIRDIDVKNEEFYKTQILSYKSFINDEKIDIPNNRKDFTRKKLKKLKLEYPSPKSVLDQNYTKDCSSETSAVWPGSIGAARKAYICYSNYIHGNHLTGASHGNEKFWILGTSVILSSLLVELVNKKTINNIRVSNFESWLIDVKANKKAFTKFWKLGNLERQSSPKEDNLT